MDFRGLVVNSVLRGEGEGEGEGGLKEIDCK